MSPDARGLVPLALDQAEYDCVPLPGGGARGVDEAFWVGDHNFTRLGDAIAPDATRSGCHYLEGVIGKHQADLSSRR